MWTETSSGSLIEQALRRPDVTTARMQAAIKDWLGLYYRTDTDPDVKEDPCQRMAYTVVNKLHKTVFGEYNAKILDAAKTAAGQRMQDQLDEIDRAKRRAMQAMLSGGDAYIKPILRGPKQPLGISVVRRDCYTVLARDDQGNDTAVGMLEITRQNGKVYTLVEERSIAGDGRLTIRNRLYCADQAGQLGSPTPLATLPQYETLPEEYTYREIMGLGMAKLHSPADNCVDGSPDGAAIYAPAAGLIHRIDHNEWLLGREFDHGQSRIIASEDMLTRDKRGRNRMADDIFVAVDDEAKNVGVTIFSPALREASFLARKNEYLRNIETLIGFKRGILSEVEAVERTATEITSSEGDYNLTIQDLQQAWAEMLRELLTVCDAIDREYKRAGAGQRWDPDSLVIDWGDGVLYNRDRTWAEYQQMVASGMLRPEIALGWYFGLPTDSESDLKKIRKKYMPEMEQLGQDEPDPPPLPHQEGEEPPGTPPAE